MRIVESLAEVASDYDAIVFDQWGVLHDGRTGYPLSIQAVTDLNSRDLCLAVLSNSGKRAEANRERIEAMGYPRGLFAEIMSSGEALWRDMAAGVIAERRFFAIEREAGDAVRFAAGLDIDLCTDVAKADALLLMGLPDNGALDDWDAVLRQAIDRDVPAYCSNPDRKSPRSGGVFVLQPGAVAETFENRGGKVTYYGKPHLPVFTSLQKALGLDSGRLLMVGDSMEHDIGGASAAGWDTLLIWGGVHKDELPQGGTCGRLDALARSMGVPLPTYAMADLR